MTTDGVEIGGAGRVDLRVEPDFRIGPMKVCPASHEVLGGGWVERLEPKVMQVLVALARAEGAVVTREDLFETCWDGRIVGEDALHRCIARLRRLTQSRADALFVVETLPKVGYRLVHTELRHDPAQSLRQAEGARKAVSGAVRPLRLALAAGALVLLAAVGWRLWSSRPADWRITEIEPIISTPLIERHPAISPDGRMIAYSAGADIFSRQIYLKRITGGEAIRMTSARGDNIAPAWSPDGSRIAFTSFTSGEPCRIMTAPVPAGSAREMGRCRTAQRSHLVWAPAGEGVLFEDSASPDAPSQIEHLDFTTQRVTPVSHPPPQGQGDSSVALSPDRRSIAFLRESDRGIETIVQELGSGVERTVQANQSWGLGLAWADDSRTLFEDPNLGGDHSVWAVPLDGGPKRRLTSSPLKLGRMSAGPGGLLAVETELARFDLAEAAADPVSAPTVIEPAHDRSWSPAFAPDATLAFASDRSGSMAIWMMRPGRRATEWVRFGTQFVFNLAWSPDGSKLAFVHASDVKRLSVRVIDASGADIAAIPLNFVQVGAPAWDDSGRSLIVPAKDPTGWRLWRCDLRRPDRLAPASDYGWRSARVRGGALYATRVDAPGVWRFNPGLPASRVSRGPNIEQRPFATTAPQRGLRWTIAGDEIVFIDRENAPVPTVVSQPIRGGPEKIIGFAKGYFDGVGFAVSPLTRRPVYFRMDGDDSDIMLMRLKR